ncbi:MAG: hypothetical protein CME59_14445 [Halioglobus sp.]|nr:hypothetical protein [Halioglobus sp.]
MLGKFVLWVSALSFISYGLACLLDPSLPAGYAGLAIENGDGFAEIGAMYGGLQTGFGLLCLLGALRAEAYRPALLMIVVVIGFLAVARLYSALVAAEALGGYTWGAMGYEFATAILAALALRGAAAKPATP